MLREQGFGLKYFLPRPQYGILEGGISRPIALFERRFRGAARTPLTLPYPFRTSTTSTRMEAERDNREVRKFLYFERYSPVILRILMYGEVDKIKLGKTLLPNWRHI